MSVCSALLISAHSFLSACCCSLVSPTDLGPDGIAQFLHLHVCSKYCRKEWVRAGMRPSGNLPVQKGTSMSLPFEPKSAPALTGRRRIADEPEEEEEEEDVEEA